MRALFLFSFLAAASFAVVAQQQEPDKPASNAKEQQQPKGEPESPAAKARIRVDGAAGGTAPVPEEARKGVGAGAKPHLHFDQLKQGLHRRVPDPVIEPPK
jgi:hypothetical protein